MTDAHEDIHQIYARIRTIWDKDDRVITEDDRRNGKRAKVIRRCRDWLGGRDQDLVGPEGWEKSCREGRSVGATYSGLPRIKHKQTWAAGIHDVAHWLYPMLPSDDYRRYGAHDLGHARLELELTELVAGWLRDEANRMRRSFPHLKLSRPPNLRLVHA